MRSAPALKIIKRKQLNKYYSPWLNRGLLKSINKNGTGWKKKVYSVTHYFLWAKVQSLQKQIKSLMIRFAKRTYYDSN